MEEIRISKDSAILVLKAIAEGREAPPTWPAFTQHLLEDNKFLRTRLEQTEKMLQTEQQRFLEENKSLRTRLEHCQQMLQLSQAEAAHAVAKQIESRGQSEAKVQEVEVYAEATHFVVCTDA